MSNLGVAAQTRKVKRGLLLEWWDGGAIEKKEQQGTSDMIRQMRKGRGSNKGGGRGANRRRRVEGKITVKVSEKVIGNYTINCLSKNSITTKSEYKYAYIHT